ncbi:hypothetical protein, partial [Gemella cuniculi]
LRPVRLERCQAFEEGFLLGRFFFFIFYKEERRKKYRKKSILFYFCIPIIKRAKRFVDEIYGF